LQLGDRVVAAWPILHSDDCFAWRLTGSTHCSRWLARENFF
jgi:hypothetical protein